MSGWRLIGVWLLACWTGPEPQVVRVALNAAGEVDLATVTHRLAAATGITLDPLGVSVELPTLGRSRLLTLRYLTDALQPDVQVELTPEAVVFTIGPDPANAAGGPGWDQRLQHLATRTRAEADRRSRYGFRARPSYIPNDPSRPTLCLLHGLNSSSLVFKHLIPPLEAAGYGVVTYDFPYNRDMDDTSADFGIDLATFRQARGESARWVVLAHSMGSLLARSYVEAGAGNEPSEIAALLLLAPPNHGSNLALGQTLMQTVQTLQSVRGERRTDPLAYLGDGLGAAADDLAPGSAYLNALNARPRRAGVAYRILAGDAAYLNAQSRRQVEARLGAVGPFGGFGRLIASGISGPLDEITDGLGDGCVSVASARLDGVSEFQVMHVNHLELIRAPLLFPEPGPVASMPILLGWLKELTDSKAIGR